MESSSSVSCVLWAERKETLIPEEGARVGERRSKKKDFCVTYRVTHKDSRNNTDFKGMFSNTVFITSHFDVQPDISGVQRTNTRQLRHSVSLVLVTFIFLSRVGNTLRHLRGNT